MIRYPKVAYDLASWSPRLGPESVLSLDFEFDKDERPTILGMSVDRQAVSVAWSPRAAAALRSALESGCRVAGHNVLDADVPLVEAHMKMNVPLERIDDTIVLHQLANSWFQNVTDKRKGGDENEGSQRGVGLLDLWSFASLYTNLPQWKVCRDGLAWDTMDPPAPQHCSGPCPVHSKRWYNGIDAWAVDDALPVLLADHANKGIPRATVDRVQACMVVARKMRERGIRVDVPYIEDLRREFEAARAQYFEPRQEPRTCGGCARMSKSPPPCKRCRDSGRPLDSEKRGIYYTDGYAAPFNPASPKQVGEWFAKQGVKLDDTSKDQLKRALDRTPADHPAYEWLDRLYSYKDEGKGVDSWFDSKYIGADSCLHPRSIPIGTSSGRWASSYPNYQNMPKRKRGIFARIRGGVVAFPGEHLLRMDYGQMEYRHMLWNAYVMVHGAEPPKLERELFTPLLPSMGNTLKRAADINARSERDILKTVVYAAIYGEGAKVLTGEDLERDYIKRTIDAGALIVHHDWPVGDGFMCFTGVNLADRLFGSATWKNRAIALAIQEQFFTAEPILRDLHRYVTKFVERGHGTTYTGRYLHLEGPYGDRFKDICAHIGQGAVDYVEEGILRLASNGLIPMMMVHDELDFSLPSCYTRNKMREIVAAMEEPSKVFPGLTIPMNAQFGMRWLEKEMEEL